MDLTQLRSFVTLARELHFGRAAQKLNMTQPPLSRQIRKLEESLGVTLFDRTSHSVELTAAGRDLLPEATEILQRCAQLTETARAGADRPAGALRMGFIAASTYRYMPMLLAQAAQDFPNLQISLFEMTAAQQLDALALGEIDIGLVRPVVPPSQVETLPVWTEQLAVVLPLDNALARKRRITMPDIRNERLVSFQAMAPYMHQMLDGIFRSEQVFPQIAQQVAHAQSILSLVSVGLGIGIVPQDARYASFDNIVFRPLILKRPVQAELHLIHWRDTRNRAVHQLAELARVVGQRDAPPLA
ncbi:LysR family transcriptional regulator [Pseudooceanicola sp. C21-150M6]|uniref:LysR family transcriptional regulator n=1 Tax=Pseudooceanicola sp. C21-150M6 TaxID=3434355 RepID=UPI003D7FCF6A